MKKFCPCGIHGSFKTFSSQVYVQIGRAKGSQPSSFDVSWRAEDLECCNKIILEKHANRNGEYQKTSTGVYQGSSDLLYSDKSSWAIGPTLTSRGLRTYVGLSYLQHSTYEFLLDWMIWGFRV